MANKTILLVEDNLEYVRLIQQVLKKNNISIPILIFMALLALTACVNEPLQPMRIGMHVWPGFEPLFLARHIESLNERDFRLVEFSNGSEVGRAFRNGTLEAACLTLDEVFYLIQDGMDPVILLVMDESRGADAVLARPEIKSLSELRGKRIAVEVSAVEAYMLIRTLQKAGLTMKDVTPVYLPIEKHFSAYKNGLVDAVVTYEPVRTKLLEQGAVDLFNSSMMPGEIVDVLVVHRDYLEGHPERAISLRKAWFTALEQIRQSPHESANFMAIREQMTTDEFESSLQRIHFPDEQENHILLKGNAPKLLIVAELLKTVMIESGLLRENIPLKPLFVLQETMKTK
ncbi:MAG: ABC transporter substrate-binding protein [Bacteroidales bacterium]|nr:ABC transporter substrate-binding protein [Bacteroidales bacterium]